MSFRFALVAALALFVTACGSSSNNSNPTAPTPTPPASSGTTVNIPVGASTAGAAAFNPNPVTIATGTTVTFHNADAVTHTATGDNAGSFDTGNISAGGNANVTFSTAGTVKYHCAIHPGMIGTIVVQ
jgi:plastocyanin